MGLPLFIEPVESDLPNKTSSKAGLTSPSRADSRQHSRSEIRDRRNGIRRAGSVRIYGPMQRSTPRNARERFLPWVESPREQDSGGTTPTDQAEDGRSGMFREALQEMIGADDSRREPIEERMILYNWHDRHSSPPPPRQAAEPENLSEGLDSGWLSIDALRRVDLRPPPGVHPGALRVPRHPVMRTVPSIFGRTNSGPDEPPSSNLPPREASRDSPAAAHEDVSVNQPPLVRSLSARQMMPGRRAARGVDGLGDRDRSLSPEVWDTLLATLTPDPQPPSAGSSFASVAASHTAGPSSGTPTTAPDMTVLNQAETSYESGCDCSDNERDTPDFDHPDLERVRRRRLEARDRELRALANHRVPDYNLDGMAEPYLTSMGSRTREPYTMMPLGETRPRYSGEGRPARQINTPNGSLTIYESTVRLGQPNNTSHQTTSTDHLPNTSRSYALSSSLLNASQRNYPSLLQNQEAPASLSRANSSSAEDDLAGMQRIVRRLARREDIPDEWWANAGLSRILSQGENASHLSGGTRSHDVFDC
ncbi:hypothetical protein QQS21_006232 [Conoideocrella luteorostrata]|uniref:Uncharacterized protein n=1 Tax=Conoideocrella luteorostrata TaxID=1105319 RepID=A0AAJ0CN13_9HYPO|nr:hypothetical protein QQS21_006232 [Conoideocrella luteorostrata]